MLNKKTKFHIFAWPFQWKTFVINIISSSLCFSCITGSQHSGTAEEDLSITNDLDNSKNEPNTNSDKEHDSEDEDGIDCKCNVCDRQCEDIEQ